jgi:hypothetical protein
MVLITPLTSKLRDIAIMLMLPLLLVNSTFAQSTRMFPVNENFESTTFPPAEWSLYNMASMVSGWSLTTQYNHTPDGTSSAYHEFAAGANDNWLVTPVMDIPSSGVTVLSFWNYTLDPPYYGRNSLLISTGSGNPADGDFVEIWSPANVVAEWKEVALNLQSYSGQTLYVAFRYEGDFAHAWAIDDVYIGNDYNTSPELLVNPVAINATVPINSGVTKKLTVTNGGLDNLVYSMEIAYEGNVTGWLSMDPVSGNLGGGSNLQHIITFDPTGLELSTYSATITISSNDPELAELVIPVSATITEPSSIEVTILMQDYTYPFNISEDGKYVTISGFDGVQNWVWSKADGLHPIPEVESGLLYVSATGVVSGTSINADYPQSPLMAGFWDFRAEQWIFLETNPAAGEPINSDYNSAWGGNDDGSVVVGMQYYPGGSYKAFKWTEGEGYNNIGAANSMSNRPNGVSRDGNVVFGWEDTPTVPRAAVVWMNDEVIQLAPDVWGEANDASSTGEYVAGYAGDKAFVWSAQTGTILFENPFNDGTITANVAMDDGTVMGYTVEGFPPMIDARRAYVRYIDGEITTFNDYAANRGFNDASDWIFYSINDATGDGNKFIGSGVNPDGQNVTFLIDFASELASINVLPTSLTEAIDVGNTSTQNLEIQNIGNAPLDYQTFINYLPSTKVAQVLEVPVGKNIRPGAIQLHSKPVRGSIVSQKSSRDAYILNYDGEHVEAVGLVSGGIMYCAARFPAAMVNPFTGASIQSVDVYINDLPADAMLMVWGPGTTNAPGALIHLQEFTPEANSWITINLDESLSLNGTDIWIGCQYTHDAETFPAGIDGGPANPNGDFVSMDGVTWEHLAANGLNGNLNIRAMLQLGQNTWLSLDPSTGTISAGSSENITATFDATSISAGIYHANIIINSNDKLNPVKVVPVTLDILVGVKENSLPAVKMYPVPATNQLNIQLVEGIKSIRMFNSSGQKALEKNVNETLNVTLDLSRMNPGVYSLQFIHNNGETFSKNIIIAK